MIAIAIECMQAVGLPDFRVAASQPDLILSPLSEAQISPEICAQIQVALQHKDTSPLRTLVADCPVVTEHQHTVLLRLPFLLGRSEVLNEMAKLLHNRSAKAVLDYLTNVYNLLQACGPENRILIDLSELRGFNYWGDV